MRKLLLLIAVFGFAGSYAQPVDLIPPGCRPYSVLDDDNDGYVTFDSDYFLNGYAIPLISDHIQYDLAANYQTALTAWSYEGFVTGIWTTVLPNEQTVEIQYTYVGPGPEYVPAVYYELWDITIVLS